MNREPKIRRAHLFNRGLNVAAIALFASLAGSPFAHAASFRCPHNASASERLVCNDPTLSALDDQLAALYRNALDASNDATALEADRVSQWQWRQRNCKDKACVTDWYDRRIAELEGDVRHGRQATVQRVKTDIVEQRLAPSAQKAVLEMKHIEPAQQGPNVVPAVDDGSKDMTKAAAKRASAEEDAPLHLKKMPSGVAADARQQRLAEAHAHHVPADDVAPSAMMEAKMAAATSVFAKAAGMASIDAPRSHVEKERTKSNEEKAPDRETAQTPTEQDAKAKIKPDATVVETTAGQAPSP